MITVRRGLGVGSLHEKDQCRRAIVFPANFVTGYEAVLVDLHDRDFLVFDLKNGVPRFVQVCRTDDELVVEVSGPVADGGPADLTPDEQSWLIGLGVDPPSGHPDRYPNFRVAVGSAEARRAAQLMVGAMSMLGLLGAECTVEGGNFNSA
jgi:hypothetical protein